MVTGIRREAEQLASPMAQTYRPGGADRAVRAGCRRDRILIDRECHPDRVVRVVVRKRVARTWTLIHAIHEDAIHMVAGTGCETEELARTVIHRHRTQWAN